MIRLGAVLPAMFLTAALMASPAAAEDRRIVLAAPAALQQSGLLDYILPRFALKHGIRVSVVDAGDASASAQLSADPSADGRTVFSGPGGDWQLAVLTATPHVARLQEWFASDAGRNAIGGFEVAGIAPFGPPERQAQAVAAVDRPGDAGRGAVLSLELCGRCHVVGEVNRMKGIGSTPSFAVMRTFADWENRFVAFYALKPHAAFTQVAEVTPPFDPERPPAISPIELTLEDVDSIVAYVAEIPPADLGAPIHHQ